ncbi:hypothetical protein MTO96_050179 [Rhipicephalus appendiculatus]
MASGVSTIFGDAVRTPAALPYPHRSRRRLQSVACSRMLWNLVPVPTRRSCVMNKCSDSARSSARNLRHFSYRCLLQTPRQPQDVWCPRETAAERSTPQ